MLEAFQQELLRNGKVDFYVRARPGAPVTKFIDQLDDQSIKIDIAAPAEGGKANRELLRFVSKEFGVPLDGVSIVSGATSRMKLVRVGLAR